MMTSPVSSVGLAALVIGNGVAKSFPPAWLVVLLGPRVRTNESIHTHLNYCFAMSIDRERESE